MKVRLVFIFNVIKVIYLTMFSIFLFWATETAWNTNDEVGTQQDNDAESSLDRGGFNNATDTLTEAEENNPFLNVSLNTAASMNSYFTNLTRDNGCNISGNNF